MKLFPVFKQIGIYIGILLPVSIEIIVVQIKLPAAYWWRHINFQIWWPLVSPINFLFPVSWRRCLQKLGTSLCIKFHEVISVYIWIYIWTETFLQNLIQRERERELIFRFCKINGRYFWFSILTFHIVVIGISVLIGLSNIILIVPSAVCLHVDFQDGRRHPLKFVFCMMVDHLWNGLSLIVKLCTDRIYSVGDTAIFEFSVFILVSWNIFLRRPDPIKAVLAQIYVFADENRSLAVQAGRWSEKKYRTGRKSTILEKSFKTIWIEICLGSDRRKSKTYSCMPRF